MEFVALHAQVAKCAKPYVEANRKNDVTQASMWAEKQQITTDRIVVKPGNAVIRPC